MYCTRQCTVWCELSTVAYGTDFRGGEHQKPMEPAAVQDEGIWSCRKLGMGTLYTGRFIMFSVITNIYNKKIKGPTLMELFTATGKLKKFFLTTRDVIEHL